MDGSDLIGARGMDFIGASQRCRFRFKRPRLAPLFVFALSFLFRGFDFLTSFPRLAPAPFSLISSLRT